MRKLLFEFTKWVIRKYFSEGLEIIEGSEKMQGKAIAWKWTFIDEKWEQVRYPNIKH